MKIKYNKKVLETELSSDLQVKISEIDNKPDSNSPITPATKPKITYDANGFVTGGTDLIASDIPSITLSKISDAGTVANKNTGINSGNVPILDGQGKLLIDVIPSAVTGGKTFKGVWDASTEAYPATPTLASGDFWTISVQGVIEGVSFNVNDDLLYNGVDFDKIDNTGSITFAQDIIRRGFVNSTDTEVPYLSGTELDVVNLDDSGAGWSYYWSGQKYTFTGNKTLALTGGEGNVHANGIHWFYIDNGTGTLKTSTTVPNLLSDVIVCYVFWSQSLESGKRSQIADERHTIKWDSSVHRYAHMYVGSQYRSGADVSGYTLNSDVDVNKQYSLSSATMNDEDLLISATPLVGGNGQYTNGYRLSSNTWGWDSDNNFPFRYINGGRMVYDSATPTGTECGNNKYVNTFVILSNLIGQGRFITMTSQTQYSTLNEAVNESYIDLTLTGLDLPEYVILYKLTWHVSDSYSSTGKCVLKSIDYIKKNYIELVKISNISTADIDEAGDKLFVSDAQKTVLGNTSGVNTGDETQASIKTKLDVASSGVDGYLSGANWITFNGKQDALGYTPAKSILYGSLYEDTLTSTTLNLTSAGTYYKWASSVVGLNFGITVDATNDNITILTTGVYKVTLSASVGSDKANNNLRVSLFKNDTRVDSVSALQRISVVGIINNMVTDDLINLTAGDVLDVRFTASVNNTALSIYNVNLNLIRIG